jgi:hypothetical protein
MFHDHLRVAVRCHSAVNGGGGLGGERRGGGRGRSHDGLRVIGVDTGAICMGVVLSVLVVPAAELVTVVHAGSYRDFDLAYGALATHVAQHAIGVDGPIREYFLVGPHDTRDETAWRTEIGWPVFHTTTAKSAPTQRHP